MSRMSELSGCVADLKACLLYTSILAILEIDVIPENFQKALRIVDSADHGPGFFKWEGGNPVSYTHLDVYKRQGHSRQRKGYSPARGHHCHRRQPVARAVSPNGAAAWKCPGREKWNRLNAAAQQNQQGKGKRLSPVGFLPASLLTSFSISATIQVWEDALLHILHAGNL